MKPIFNEPKKSIKELNVSIESLYKAKDMQVLVWMQKKPAYWSLILKSGGMPDCKLSSFHLNIYFRTAKGIKYEKYSSLAILQREVIKRINSVMEDAGEITFSLTKEVRTI